MVDVSNMQPYKYPLSLPLPPPRSARRAAPRSARSLFRRRSTANQSKRAAAGAAGTTSITTAGFTRGKGYPQELTQPDACPSVFVEIRPARQVSARTVIYSRHESHPIRPADRFHINNGAFLSHDDAAAPHQVAHRGVRGRHPGPPIRSVARGREPPRRLRRSARLARAARLEDAQRLRRELGLARRLAGALRRWRLVVSARTLARRGQLSEHACGRHAPVRVEDDPFGFQQRALALDRRRGRAPLTTKSAQTSVRRDHSLSGHSCLGGAVLAHNGSDGPRATARDRSHGPIRRHLAFGHAAHDGVHLGLEGCRHPLTCYASDAALPLHTQPVLGSEGCPAAPSAAAPGRPARS